MRVPQHNIPRRKSGHDCLKRSLRRVLPPAPSPHIRGCGMGALATSNYAALVRSTRRSTFILRLSVAGRIFGIFLNTFS